MRTPCSGLQLNPFLLGCAFIATCCRSPQPLPQRPEPASPSASPTSQPPPPRNPSGARLVTSSNLARRLELTRADGTVATRFYPGFFNQVLLVPDVEGNSGRLIARSVAGSDVLAAAFDPKSRRVLVAIRGFIYAEVSTDLVFVIDANQPQSPPDPASAQPLFYDGPDVIAEPAPGRERGRRAFNDVADVGFAEGGRLRITLSDASGGVCRLEYDAALRPLRCSWEGGESRKCPAGLTATAWIAPGRDNPDPHARSPKPAPMVAVGAWLR